MSKHNAPQTLHSTAAHQKDPGDAGTITVDRSPAYADLVSAAAETRTLARPTVGGAIVTLNMKTDGGDITLTVTGGFNEDADTTYVFASTGEHLTLVAVDVGGTLTWRVLSSDKIGNLAEITATAAEINAAADVSGRIVTVTDAATYTVLAADSGKPHILPDFTSSCTLTLPTAAAGLEYEFYPKFVAVDAQNWVFSTGGANFFLGGLSFLDNDAGAGADEVHAGVYPNGSSNDFMTIVTPAAGTRIKIICDGTNWIVSGIVVSATIPAFSDT